MPKTKTGKFAVGFTAVGFLFVLIAFVSPYWLQADKKIRNPKFQKIGLWEVCFKDFEDIHHWYDTRFTGCWWVFEEEFYIIGDFLLPGFFVATQFFFTVCMTLLLIAVALVALFCICSRHHDRYLLLLLTVGTDLIIAGISGLIAVIIFGIRGDGRDWMPNWEHNDMGWAYALAVLGSIALLPAGTLFLVEARRTRYRRLNELQAREGSVSSGYGMQERKSSHHTDI
ncbi:uncharacterized protein LOC113370698 [Ctenocephalides felis]|uniref:uncharacterized protein LOC113370692 n=1 Tax=Ctenocephalides felis TaxID=7515 RepID=UPI000E6E40FA|nr:uncharacterized protein LOC113370692 [Ctenocephalides felis]XP_026467178.1 uncharacterized protein LOC113370698 [Ctenocephalides felis]